MSARTKHSCEIARSLLFVGPSRPGRRLGVNSYCGTLCSVSKNLMNPSIVVAAGNNFFSTPCRRSSLSNKAFLSKTERKWTGLPISKGPFLCRHYSASSVLCPSPTPDQTGIKCAVAGRGPASGTGLPRYPRYLPDMLSPSLRWTRTGGSVPLW